MAILTKTLPDFKLSSKFTVSYASGDMHDPDMYVSSASLAKVTKYFSFPEIPAGATINSAKLSCSVGGSMYGGTATQDGKTTLSNLAINITPGSARAVQYTFKSNTNVPYGTAAGTKTGTATFSNVKLVIDYIAYTDCKAPTSVSLAKALAKAGELVRLSWSGAAAGTSNPIAGYDVYRATASGGPYSRLGGTTAAYMDVAANDTAGASYYFRVLTKGTASGYDSGLSTVNAGMKTNTPPAMPTVNAPAANQKTYNTRPIILVTLGEDVDGHLQTLAAEGYEVSRVGALAAGAKLRLRKTDAGTSGAQAVDVAALDELGDAGAAANVAFNIETLTLTDPTLTSGTTKIKAAHMLELRTAVNAVRAYYGMNACSWAENIVSGVTGLAGWSGHVAEIRAAIDEVVTLVNGWDTESDVGAITLPDWIAVAVNRPTAAVMQQIRDAISQI